MKTLNVLQGSPEWLAARAGKFCASDAPAVMNASKYKSRSDLLREKAGAGSREVSATEQALFDRGHETEAAIRPYIESLIGDELYPVTCVDDSGRFLASMDGLTMVGDVGFEHKLINKALAEAVAAGELEPHYFWQLEHQHLVTGAEKIIFAASDGTPENCVHMEYRPVPGRREALIAGWEQFEKDLAEYQHVEVLPAPTGVSPENLPALHIQVKGEVTASNLREYKEHALKVFEGINTNLQTDTDFANAEKAVKWCGDVEEKLEASKQHALSQTKTIEELFQTIDEIKEQARSKRLMLEKLVKARKETIRIEIQQTAGKAFLDHCVAINQRLRSVRLPDTLRGNFADVMKGKKTVTSLRDAVDAELARVKIEANAIAEKMDANLRTLNELAADHKYLFTDVQQIVMKDNADLVNLIKMRISEHEAAEKAKREAQLEKEREVIRKQEEAKAEAKLKAEEAARIAAEKAEADKAVQPVTQPIVTEVKVSQPAPVVTSVSPSPVRPAPVAVRSSRPSSKEIISVLAKHYSVDEDTVIDWLAEIDLAEVA